MDEGTVVDAGTGTGTADTGTGTVDLGTGTVDTSTGTGTIDTGAGTGIAETDEFSALESLYDTLGTDDAAGVAAAADGDTTQSAMPEEVTRALGLSDYFTEAAHL